MTKTILLVEDQKSVALMIGRMLESAGYRYEHSLNGREAMERLRRGPRPDMILLDIVMPVMSGYEFLEELGKEEELKDLPVIILSGRGEATDVLKAVKRGAIDYVTKPVEQELLLSRLERIFEKYRQEGLSPATA